MYSLDNQSSSTMQAHKQWTRSGPVSFTCLCRSPNHHNLGESGKDIIVDLARRWWRLWTAWQTYKRIMVAVVVVDLTVGLLQLVARPWRLGHVNRDFAVKIYAATLLYTVSHPSMVHTSNLINYSFNSCIVTEFCVCCASTFTATILSWLTQDIVNT